MTGEGAQHNHCICVGALTYYMSQKGHSIECSIDCDGSNFASPSYLSEEAPKQTTFNNGKSPYQATKPARDAVALLTNDNQAICYQHTAPLKIPTGPFK